MDACSARASTDMARQAVDTELLLQSFSGVCEAVHELAMHAVCARHISILSPGCTLTKEDCRVILDSTKDNFTVTEEAVALWLLTDFVMSVCTQAEQLPEVGHKKGLSQLLVRLQRRWNGFLRRLHKPVDLTETKVESLLRLLRQLVHHLSHTHHKSIFRTTVVLAEKIARKWKLKSHTSKAREAALPPDENMERPVDMLTYIEEETVFTTSPTVKAKVETRQRNMGKSSHKTDNCKLILQSCENTGSPKKEEDVAVGTQDCSTCTNGVNVTTHVTTPSCASSTSEKPPMRKKPRLDDCLLINGKVNAFKLLMEKSCKKGNNRK